MTGSSRNRSSLCGHCVLLIPVCRALLWPTTIALAGLIAGNSRISADETLLAEDAAFSVHIDPLEALAESPLFMQIAARLQSSVHLDQGLQTVEVQQLREAVRFLEQRLGQRWPRILADLTAGGVDLAVRIEREPQLLIAFQTVSNDWAADLIDVAIDVYKLSTGGGQADVPSGQHRGITGYRLGNAAIARVESRFLVASNPELLKEAVGSLLDHPVHSAELSPGDEFRASARLNLSAFRSLPDVADGLKIPAEDGGLIAVLGGWVDLLRRHERVTIDFRLSEKQIEAVLRFNGAVDPSPSAFDGYWADAVEEHPAPLLMVPGVIYSTSWYRDYGALWNARDQLVTTKVVKQMEQADGEAAAQFEALGSAVPLSEVVQQLGPRLRVVVAEQAAPPYEFELRNQLPAAALVIELDDEEAFRDLAAPLARVVHLILSFEQKITSDRLEYAGAQLDQLSFPHTVQDVARRDQAQYNIRPTHCVTRGHFLIGTTPDIVRQCIDAIDAQAGASDRRAQTGITSEQFVDIGRLAQAIERVRDGIVRRSVLEGGLDVGAAAQELDVFLSLIRLFDKKTVTGVFTEDGFEHRVTVTTNASQYGRLPRLPRASEE